MLLVGASEKEITPPLAVGLLTSSVEGKWAPFESVRLPLKVRVLVIKLGEVKVGIVALDLLGLSDTSVGGWHQFKKSLSDWFTPDEIIIHCTHTHNAPESVGITNLHTSSEYIAWLQRVRVAITECLVAAEKKSSACTLQYGSETLDMFSLQRRVPTNNGVVISDSLQPITPEFFAREPVDRRIRAVKLLRSDKTVAATVVHAVCHPVHEMCIPEISPDYPGEVCAALDDGNNYGLPIFLNGAAGDINPPTVSGGKECARAHGAAIAGTVGAMEFEDIVANQLAVVHRELHLSTRGFNQVGQGDYVARISVVSLGDLALVFIPGEPFVQTGLDIERSSPFKRTLVIGYCENSVGYLPPLSAFREGGYEAAAGKWSYAGVDSEARILAAVSQMFTELHGNIRLA